MRIVFMGASELGWECCNALLNQKYNVVGILTIPQNFKISWSLNPVHNVRYKSFEDLSQKNNIPLVYVEGKMNNPDLFNRIKEFKPDIFIVIGWYYMIPRKLRELANMGAIGIHASLLPKYRGGAPLVWAIINGEKEAGVSLFDLSDGVDDGNIIGQKRFSIGMEEDIAEIVKKSIHASKSMLLENIQKIIAGKASRTVQDESQATLFPQRKPEDGLLDWMKLDCINAYNWIRAQTKPYPGAYSFLESEKIYIWKAKPTKDVDLGEAPGNVIFRDKVPHVICADKKLLEIQKYDASRDLSPGDRLKMTV